MGYNRDRDGDAVAGWIVGMLVVAAVVGGAFLAASAIRVIPVIWRSMTSLTHILSPSIAGLTNKLIHWPSEGSITSPGTASLLGAILWAGFALLGSTLCVILGASPAVILVTTALGAMVGAAAGAASVAQPNQPAGENLDDYLRF